MKTFLVFAVIAVPVMLPAQNAITSNVVEGGKTLVELIKVLKPPKAIYTTASYPGTDSCASKKMADISFKNKTDKIIQVFLFLRTGNTYETQALSLKLAPSSQESLYDVKAGIYKYRIESDIAGQITVMHEGELKLQPCDKEVKEIKE
jgi:hypothetical protein